MADKEIQVTDLREMVVKIKAMEVGGKPVTFDVQTNFNEDELAITEMLLSTNGYHTTMEINGQKVTVKLNAKNQ